MKRIFILLFSVMLFAVAVKAQTIDINITEWGKTISYYEDYWIVNVNGSIEITNPANNSLSDLTLAFSTGSLRITELTNTGWLTDKYLTMYNLQPGTTTVEYNLIGISPDKPYKYSDTILGTLIMNNLGYYSGGQIRLYSRSIGTLMKAIPEDPTQPSNRLISVVMKNPTPLAFYIDYIKIIKTSGLNPNPDSATGWLDQWNFPSDLFDGRFSTTEIPGYSEYVIDFIDKNSSEGEVYWLSTNYFTTNITINRFDLVSHYTEKDLEVIVGNNTNISELSFINTTLLEFPIFLRKSVSDTLLMPGDIVDVTLSLYNFEPSVKNAEIIDYVPLGFIITDGSNGTLNWTAKLSPNSVFKKTYKLKYVDRDSVGLDYFKPAEASVGNRTFFSRTIPFVRQFIPDKRLFVQKKLRYLLDDEVEVKVEIRNLGESSINNIVLKEYLLSTDAFREITKQPDSKGVWKIDSVAAGDTWSVTYITSESENVNLLPEVFGVESSFVLKSLLLESIIHSSFRLTDINFIEYAGIAIIVLLPVLYFMLNKRFTTKTKLKLMEYDRRIRDLKKVSASDNSKNISELRKNVGEKRPDIRYENAESHHNPAKEIEDNEEKIKDITEQTKPNS